MGWLGTFLSLSILLEEVMTSAIDSPHTRAKRQMHLSSGGPSVFPTTKVGNTYQLKYFLDSDVEGSSIGRGWDRVMKLFEEKTCLSFLKVAQEGDGIATLTKTVPEWMRDKEPSPCYLTAGRVIYLGGGCGDEGSIGVILHEFMHLLGFMHTQQRTDRDQYLNFEVTRGEVSPQSSKSNTATEFPFDYGSIVSYPETAQCDDKNCYNITVKDERYRGSMFGQQSMQFFDYYMVNHYYKCLDLCDQKNHKCQNSGYLKPTDCSKCVCPPGFGGQFCTEREDSCGATYTADSEWKMIRKLQKPGLHPELRDELCFHLITAPPGKWIEYDITSFAPATRFHLTFFGNEDPRMSPYGFNKGLQTPDALGRLKHDVFRGNALRFRTSINGGEGCTTTVMYRFVDENTSPCSLETPTITDTDTTTPTPYVHKGLPNGVIGHKMCLAPGETPPPTMFDRDVVRAQLQKLTNVTNPKFMIILERNAEAAECPGKELYDYQLVFDITSDGGLINILTALYTGGPYFFERPSLSWSRLTAGEMQELFDMADEQRRRARMDFPFYQAPASEFPQLREIFAKHPIFTILVDEAQ